MQVIACRKAWFARKLSSTFAPLARGQVFQFTDLRFSLARKDVKDILED